MSDPKNLKALEYVIERRKKRNNQITAAGKPLFEIKFVSSFLGQRDSSRKIQDARTELRQLQAAERELAQFRREIQGHHSPSAAPKPGR